MLSCLAKCTYICEQGRRGKEAFFLAKPGCWAQHTSNNRIRRRSHFWIGRHFHFTSKYPSKESLPASQLLSHSLTNFQLSSADLPASVTDPRLYSFSLSLFQTFEPLFHFISSHLLTPLLPGRDSPPLSDIQHRRQVVQGSPSPRAQSPKYYH